MSSFLDCAPRILWALLTDSGVLNSDWRFKLPVALFNSILRWFAASFCTFCLLNSLPWIDAEINYISESFNCPTAASASSAALFNNSNFKASAFLEPIPASTASLFDFADWPNLIKAVFKLFISWGLALSNAPAILVFKP